MQDAHSLIGELETAIQSGSKDKRVDALRRITDLFVSDADRLNDQQIDVFDDVLSHLIKRIEGKALTELSQRLAPINNAPIEVVRKLARDENIAVAEPILTRSRRLSDSDLIEIANTQTQAHLLAISTRAQLGTTVTDVLLQRGDGQVFRKLAENSGAKFSDNGFATLVKHSERDETLAEIVGLRLDVPVRLFRELLMRATEAVRKRLLAVAGPESRNNIQRVLASITDDAQHEAGFLSERDFEDAHERLAALRAKGELNESALYEFARNDRAADVIAGLAILCEAPLKLVADLVQSNHREAFLIPCKAAGLDWRTVRAILTCRYFGARTSEQDLEATRGEYIKLSRSTAGRVLRFWQVRQNTTKEADGAAAKRPGSTASPQTVPADGAASPFLSVPTPDDRVPRQFGRLRSR